MELLAASAILSDPSVSGRRLLGFVLGPARGDACALAAFGAAAALLSLFPAIVLGILVLTALPRTDLPLLVELGLVLAASGVAVALFDYAKGMALVRIETTAELVGQPALFDRLVRLPLGFFSERTAGGLTERALGLSQIRRILARGLIVGVLGGLFAASNLIVMAVASWRLTLDALAAVAVLALVIVAAIRAALRHERQSQAKSGIVAGTALELVRAIDKIRVAGAEKRMSPAGSAATPRRGARRSRRGGPQTAPVRRRPSRPSRCSSGSSRWWARAESGSTRARSPRSRLRSPASSWGSARR